MNNTYTPYPLNPRYSISSNAVVIDTMTGAKVPIHYTPTNKQYVRLLDDDGTYHTVYMVYMLAITFKGFRPSINHHATLINPRGCYCADNVAWQSENEARAKKIKIDKIKKILEAKTLDELDIIFGMIDMGITPPVKKEYPPIPPLPPDVAAAIATPPTPTPKKTIKELLAK